MSNRNNLRVLADYDRLKKHAIYQLLEDGVFTLWVSIKINARYMRERT